MNRRIRKKKEKQMMIWAVNELVAGYRRQVDEREKRCKELSAQYGICVEPDEDDPLGLPPIIAATPEIMQEQKQWRRQLRAFVRHCEQRQAQRG